MLKPILSLHITETLLREYMRFLSIDTIKINFFERAIETIGINLVDVVELDLFVYSNTIKKFNYSEHIHLIDENRLPYLNQIEKLYILDELGTYEKKMFDTIINSSMYDIMFNLFLEKNYTYDEIDGFMTIAEHIVSFIEHEIYILDVKFNTNLDVTFCSFDRKSKKNLLVFLY